MLKKITTTVLTIFMILTSGFLNISADEEEHIYLMPNQTTYITVDGTLDLSNFDSSVATIITNNLSGGDNIAQLGTNSLYDGDMIDLKDAVYVFEKVADRTYKIKSVKNNLYLIADGNYDTYHSASEKTVELRQLEGTDEFALVGNNGRCLFFEYLETGNKRIDHWSLADRFPNTSEKSLVFHLYKYEEVEGVPTYNTSLNTYPEDGEKCIIVAEVADNSGNINSQFKYVLYPNADTSKSGPYSQVAKWHVGKKQDAITELKISASSTASASNFTVTKGTNTTTYRVHIADVPSDIINSDVFVRVNMGNDEVSKVTMMVGSQYQIQVKNLSEVLYWISENENVASVENGLITANGTRNNAIFDKIHIGYIEKGNFKKHAMEVVVINMPVEGYKKYTNTYLQIGDNRTEVSYAWILNNDFISVRDWPVSELKAAINGEVNVGEVGIDENYALIFFGKTTDDREFEESDIKVDGINYVYTNIKEYIEANKTDIETKSSYEQNLFKLIKTADDNDWTIALIFKSEGNDDLNKNIVMKSSYLIMVEKAEGVDYSYKNDKHTIEDKTDSITINDDYKNQFNLTEAELTKTIFKEYKVYHHEGASTNEVIDAELLKDVYIDIDVSSLLNYDQNKILTRKFKVLSKHRDEIVNWGTYEENEGFIRVKVNKFSPFAIVGVDTLVPNNNSYRAPNTGVN